MHWVLVAPRPSITIGYSNQCIHESETLHLVIKPSFFLKDGDKAQLVVLWTLGAR